MISMERMVSYRPKTSQNGSESIFNFFFHKYLEPGGESVLLVRLRLLQGILCYLTNRRDEAVAKFNDVENQIQVLKVDNENIISLCDLGNLAID